MQETKQNSDLYEIFIKLSKSTLSKNKKKQILRSLFIGEEWSWVVTGISKKSVISFRNDNFKKLPSLYQRHHFKSFDTTANELLAEGNLTFNRWSKIIEKGEKTHIVTKSEHDAKIAYDYFECPPEKGLFQNLSRSFRYTENEKKFLRSIDIKSKPFFQEFSV